MVLAAPFSPLMIVSKYDVSNVILIGVRLITANYLPFVWIVNA